jgi:hypothetical protein
MIMSQYPFEADTARLESASSIVQSSWNSWHSSATCRNLRLLVNTSHAVAITVSCLQSVQLNSFPFLWTIPFHIRLQVFTMVSSQIPVYRVLTPFSLVRRHLNSGVIWNLNKEIVCSPNTSLRTSMTTRILQFEMISSPLFIWQSNYRKQHTVNRIHSQKQTPPHWF